MHCKPSPAHLAAWWSRSRGHILLEIREWFGINDDACENVARFHVVVALRLRKVLYASVIRQCGWPREETRVGCSEASQVTTFIFGFMGKKTMSEIAGATKNHLPSL
ncbi:uncharacterized protein L203_102814 [Cryptococcus depauperatus CBS 7841]|uniref:Uncharacterized protein n=1 Tax=Cryptococcus depauperatus CBS 7841 TaxID=1295531 RepID=A0AAJ8M1G2_9TREE